MLVKHLIHILDFSHIFSFPDPNNSYYYFVKIWNRLFFLSSHGIGVLRYLQNDMHAVYLRARGSHVLVWAI